MIVTVRGVLLDGSVPTPPTDPREQEEQPISIEQGEDATIIVPVKNVTGADVNMTGGSGVLAVMREPVDASSQGVVAPISRPAVITVNVMTFTLVPADTMVSPTERYRYVVVYVSADGKRHHVIPLSAFEVRPSAAVPNALVTIPTGEPPQAQGPQGDSLVYRGLYSGSATYSRGDFVSFAVGDTTNLYGRLGSNDTTGVDPTDVTAWYLAVSGSAGSASIPSGVAPQYLGFDGAGNLVAKSIIAADIVQPFAILSFGVSGGTLETGASVTPTYSATYNRTPTSASVSDGTATDTLSTPFASGTAGRSYSRSTPGSQAFTLTANDGSGAVTHGASLAWEHRVWWGVAAPGALIEATAQGLASSALRAGRAGAFDFAAGDGTTVSTIVIPQSFGDFTAITVRPLNLAVTSDWIKVQTGLSVTNQHGVVEVCDVWQFDAATVDPFTYDAV